MLQKLKMIGHPLGKKEGSDVNELVNLVSPLKASLVGGVYGGVC
jgi:hypothetical protein